MTIRNFNDRAGVFLFGDIQMDRCTFEQNSTYSNGGQLFFQNNIIVKMTDCVIKNGSCTGSGAGIYNSGSLEMYNCEIRNNIAVNETGSVSNAGGIYNCGTCYIMDSYIVENIADVFGGINNSGTLTIKDSLIYGNIGKMGVNDLFGRATVTYSEDFDWQERIPSGWYDDSENNRFDGKGNVTEFYGLNLTDDARLRLVFVFEDEITEESNPQPTAPEPSTPTDENNPSTTPQQPAEPEPTPGNVPDPTEPVQSVTPSASPQEPPKNDDGDNNTNTPNNPRANIHAFNARQARSNSHP